MKFDLKTLARTAVLAALALAVQLLNLRQAITGPLVNAVLFVAALYVHPLSALVIGLITPWVAFAVGIMKLAAAVPVIMAGNSALALAGGYSGREWNRYLGVIVGALLKWATMTIGVRVIIARGTRVPALVYSSLTVSQLVTAFVGGAIALLVVAGLERYDKGRGSN